MAKRGELVPRPPRKSEYEIRFATVQASKGFQELKASIRGPLADTWDFLTRTPLANAPGNSPLRGELGTLKRNGVTYERWQHKPTAQGDARIWFYVDGRTVFLEQVHTNHPNQTK